MSNLVSKATFSKATEAKRNSSVSFCLRSAAVPSEREGEGNAQAKTTESGDGDGCREAGAAAAAAVMALLNFGGWTRCALVRRRQ